MQPAADDFRDSVSSWSELSDLVEHFSFFNGHDWLFRGVTDASHGLVPKIGRKKTRGQKLAPDSDKPVRVPYRPEDERAVLTMFRQQAWPHMATSPESDLQWLAIAQHFGLPTRLLDWTDSLLVAAWFAVEKGGAKQMDSAIWVTKAVPQIAFDYKGEVLTLGQVASYRPTHISPRITAQGSVFVICPQPTEELLLPFAKKILVDRKAEFTLKKRLNACGINRRHLFPDLTGLSEHLTWVYKNDWLAGYRERSSSSPAPAATDTQDEADE